MYTDEPTMIKPPGGLLICHTHNPNITISNHFVLFEFSQKSTYSFEKCNLRRCLRRIAVKMEGSGHFQCLNKS